MWDAWYRGRSLQVNQGASWWTYAAESPPTFARGPRSYRVKP